VGRRGEIGGKEGGENSARTERMGREESEREREKEGDELDVYYNRFLMTS